MRGTQLLGLVFVAGCTYDYQGALGLGSSSASSAAASSSTAASTGAGGGAASSASAGGGSLSSSASTGGGAGARCVSGCMGAPLVQMHPNGARDGDFNGAVWKPIGAPTDHLEIALESYGNADTNSGEMDDAILQAVLGPQKPHTDNIVAFAFDASCFPVGASIASVDLVALRRSSTDGSAADVEVTVAIGTGTPIELAKKDWIHGTSPLYAEQTWPNVLLPAVSDLSNLVVKMRAEGVGTHTPTLSVDDIHIDVHLQGCP